MTQRVGLRATPAVLLDSTRPFAEADALTIENVGMLQLEAQLKITGVLGETGDTVKCMEKTITRKAHGFMPTTVARNAGTALEPTFAMSEKNL